MSKKDLKQKKFGASFCSLFEMSAKDTRLQNKTENVVNNRTKSAVMAGCKLLTTLRFGLSDPVTWRAQISVKLLHQAIKYKWCT